MFSRQTAAKESVPVHGKRKREPIDEAEEKTTVANLKKELTNVDESDSEVEILCAPRPHVRCVLRLSPRCLTSPTGRRKDNEKRARRLLSDPSEFFTYLAEQGTRRTFFGRNAARLLTSLLFHFPSPPTQITTTTLKKRLKVGSVTECRLSSPTCL